MLVEYAKIMRTVYIAGRRGGGKTSLAIALALRLVADGNADKIVSNTPLRVGKLIDEVTSKEALQLHDVAIILDEAWKEVGKRARARNRDEWFAYLRHYNQYLLMPSVLDLCAEAAPFVVERERSLTPFGIPLWIYQYSRAASSIVGLKRKHDTGRYYWWHPARVFRYYDHLYNPRESYYVYEF